MKDGRTHLAHKAEQAVDLETGAIVGVTVQDADDGDTTTSIETLIEAAEQVEAVRPHGDGIEEVVGDKGYHSNQALVDLEAMGVRSYISDPDRGRRNWKIHSAARDALYRNRRRIRGARGQRLVRLRGERLERPFAHLFETGGMRRVYLRGHANIRKRLLIHTSGFNLGLVMRHVIGVGTPRSLQGRLVAALGILITPIRAIKPPVTRPWRSCRLFSVDHGLLDFELLVQDEHLHGLSLDAIKCHGLHCRRGIQDLHASVQVIRLKTDRNVIAFNCRETHGFVDGLTPEEATVCPEILFPFDRILNPRCDYDLWHVLPPWY